MISSLTSQVFKTVLFQKWVPDVNRLSGGENLFLLNKWFRLQTQQNLGIYPDILQSLNGFNDFYLNNVRLFNILRIFKVGHS